MRGSSWNIILKCSRSGSLQRLYGSTGIILQGSLRRYGATFCETLPVLGASTSFKRFVSPGCSLCPLQSKTNERKIEFTLSFQFNSVGLFVDHKMISKNTIFLLRRLKWNNYFFLKVILILKTLQNGEIRYSFLYSCKVGTYNISITKRIYPFG